MSQFQTITFHYTLEVPTRSKCEDVWESLGDTPGVVEYWTRKDRYNEDHGYWDLVVEVVITDYAEKTAKELSELIMGRVSSVPDVRVKEGLWRRHTVATVLGGGF